MVLLLLLIYLLPYSFNMVFIVSGNLARSHERRSKWYLVCTLCELVLWQGAQIRTSCSYSSTVKCHNAGGDGNFKCHLPYTLSLLLGGSLPLHPVPSRARSGCFYLRLVAQGAVDPQQQGAGRAASTHCLSGAGSGSPLRVQISSLCLAASRSGSTSP